MSIKQDAAGMYETEVFDCDNPKSVVICAHGNGVRRWDGESFFYNVAKRYTNHAFYLVDQTQPFDGGCELIDLRLMVHRVQDMLNQACSDYPGVPITILAHSMGCGVASLLDVRNVTRMIFITPASGDVVQINVARYGKHILDGSMVKTSDGLNKLFSKEYMDSVSGVKWEEKYTALLKHFGEIYVFEAGSDEILTEERRAANRTLPFKGYKVIDGATHNFHDEALEKLYSEIDDLL